MTDLFMSDLFITNTKDRPCIIPPYISPPLYKPTENRLRKYISPGLIVGGLQYPGVISRAELVYPRSGLTPGTAPCAVGSRLEFKKKHQKGGMKRSMSSTFEFSI